MTESEQIPGIGPFPFVLKMDGKILETTQRSFEPERFLTHDEIVEDLKTRLSTETLSQLSRASDSELQNLYSYGMGRHIRNTYGLWISTNPYSDAGADPAHPSHPYALSLSIIKSLHAHLRT